MRGMTNNSPDNSSNNSAAPASPSNTNPGSPSPLRPRVLSIAGTDPTGGAGAQADLKSIMAAGGYGMSVITALVAQNTQGVREIHTPPLDFLRAQLDSVFDDVTVDAVKIGMLGNTETIQTVREYLQNHQVTTVLDPVAVASSGDRLLTANAEDALRDFAASSSVVTPNLPELALLTKTELATSEQQAVDIAAKWAQETDTTVIVKLGHLAGLEAGNIAVSPAGKTHKVSSPRVETKNTHGTGCSLSSALATRLGAGDSLEDALDWSTKWLNEAIANADRLLVGRGHGPVDHSVRLF
ncbi:phosphomethylpyrimidine kinase [Corynebacterium jeikeium]|uniref:Thiamine biosynthesis multifunctional protein ThiED n=2 Tax=Corynebacterium jeikeium TaxID=38289 RepID=Q4JXK8_CORJK|nr:phosphomethylpyrimidine kinase [Corynebacterium jeikeium K411]SUY83942.1 phosphomethylpyrimidine kinase [Corynebacterium jeikeium]